MIHIYRLQTITAMKLQNMKQLNEEIKEANTKGWPLHAAACRTEMQILQRHAMNPQEVIDEILKTLPGSAA